MLVQLHLQLGQSDQAFELCKRFLLGGMRDYERNRIGRQMAQHFAARGNFDRAVEFLDASYDDPQSAAAMGERANLYTRRELWADALPIVEEALRLNPEDPGMISQHVIVLRELGREREALDACFAGLANPKISAELAPLADKVELLAEHLDESAAPRGRSRGRTRRRGPAAARRDRRQEPP